MYAKSLPCWKPDLKPRNGLLQWWFKNWQSTVAFKRDPAQLSWRQQDVNDLDYYSKSQTTSFCTSSFLFPDPKIPSGSESATYSWKWIAFFSISSRWRIFKSGRVSSLGCEPCLPMTSGVPSEDAVDLKLHAHQRQPGTLSALAF